MLRLLGRRLLLLVVVLPLLNIVGYWYAMRAHPRQFNRYGRIIESDLATEPFTPAYREYIAGVLAGDWGLGNITLGRYVLPSLQLLAVTVAVVVILGPLLGALAISWRTGRIHGALVPFFAVGTALPGFFLASLLMLLLVIGKRSGWYEARGYLVPIQGYGFDAHLILPVLALALRPIMFIAYVTAGLLETEFQQDYVRVARSRGLHWRMLLWRHTYPNVRAATLAAIGQGLQFAIGGLILIEFLFDWRGLGWLLVNVFIDPRNSGVSVFLLNPPLLALLLPIFGLAMVAADSIMRVTAHGLDPRLRHSDTSGAFA